MGLQSVLKGVLEADLQMMVYLGILVTRKYFNWQKILSKSSLLCQNYKHLFDFLLYITEYSNIFCQNIEI